MLRIVLLSFSLFFALNCSAGQGTIIETDDRIIIEYFGDDNDVKAAQVQRAEQDKRLAEEERKKRAKADVNRRRAEMLREVREGDSDAGQPAE